MLKLFALLQKIQVMHGREFVVPPKTILPEHCAPQVGEIQRLMDVKHAMRYGKIPKEIFLDDLPEHIEVCEETDATYIAIYIN